MRTHLNLLIFSLQDVFLTAAGWALFGGMPVTFKSVLGLTGTFIGAFAYSYIGLLKQRRADEVQVTATVSATGALPVRATPMSTQVVAEQAVSETERELLLSASPTQNGLNGGKNSAEAPRVPELATFLSFDSNLRPVRSSSRSA